MYYICMECGYEWESELEVLYCPRCRCADIFVEPLEENSNDNQEHRSEEDA